MYKASDGKGFTNRPPMKAHERMLSRMSMSKAEPHADPLNPDAAANEQESGHEVAREHGPAVEVTISHEGGQHKVRSRHEDGHEHESEHESAEEAHEHGKQLAGVGMEDEEDEPSMGGEEPEFD